MSRDDDIVMTREQLQNHRGRDVLEDGSPAVLRLDESGAMALVPVVLLDFSEYERTGRLPYVNPREPTPSRFAGHDPVVTLSRASRTRSETTPLVS